MNPACTYPNLFSQHTSQGRGGKGKFGTQYHVYSENTYFCTKTKASSITKSCTCIMKYGSAVDVRSITHQDVQLENMIPEINETCSTLSRTLTVRRSTYMHEPCLPVNLT